MWQLGVLPDTQALAAHIIPIQPLTTALTLQ
jgi:hypothetical protein